MPELVPVDECIFVPIRTGEEALETHGISACICLMLYGHLADGTPFIGMHHWSGFAASPSGPDDDKKEEIFGLIYHLATTAREHLKVHQRAKIYLDKLYLVGGERRQEAPDGTLLLSGTECEVNALNKHIIAQSQHHFCTSTSTDFYTANYLTTGEQSISVTMNAIQPTWVRVDPEMTMTSSLGLGPRI